MRLCHVMSRHVTSCSRQRPAREQGAKNGRHWYVLQHSHLPQKIVSMLKLSADTSLQIKLMCVKQRSQKFLAIVSMSTALKCSTLRSHARSWKETRSLQESTCCWCAIMCMDGDGKK